MHTHIGQAVLSGVVLQSGTEKVENQPFLGEATFPSPNTLADAPIRFAPENRVLWICAVVEKQADGSEYPILHWHRSRYRFYYFYLRDPEMRPMIVRMGSIGRTVSVSLPDSSGTITYGYQGNVTTVTDPAGKWKKFTTDVFGNLTQVNEPNPAGGADYVTTYSYNLHNQLTGVSMPRGGVTQTRTFVYDLTTKRLTSATNPESGTVSYVYNTDGTLASKTDAKGQKITYEYNTNQKVTAIRRRVNATTESVCEKVIFAYGSA